MHKSNSHIIVSTVCTKAKKPWESEDILYESGQRQRMVSMAAIEPVWYLPDIMRGDLAGWGGFKAEYV